MKAYIVKRRCIIGKSFIENEIEGDLDLIEDGTKRLGSVLKKILPQLVRENPRV
jgi:hypothetical protein